MGNVKKTEVLWESFGTDVKPNIGDLVTGAGYKNGYVYFSTPEVFGNGNASIAIRNSKDVILWSWHIWCSEVGWKDHVYAKSAGTMMDRNLGATSAISAVSPLPTNAFAATVTQCVVLKSKKRKVKK